MEAGAEKTWQVSGAATNSGSRHQVVEAEHFAKPCVIRRPIEPADPADFWREVSIQSLAADHQLAPRIMEIEASIQTIVLQRATPTRLDISPASHTLRMLHSLPKVAPRLDIEHAFDFWFSQIEPSRVPWNQASNRDRAASARVLFDQHQLDQVLCHGDPVPENFMRLEGRYVLIDWEYACLAPFWWDIAIYSCESSYTETERATLITHYLAALASPWGSSSSSGSAAVAATQMQTLAKFISVYQDLREVWSLATAQRAISY